MKPSPVEHMSIEPERSHLVLRNVEVEGRITDVTIEATRVASVDRDVGSRSRRVALSTAVTVIDGRGGALIPGLHDHHVHLRSWAALARSTMTGPPSVTNAEELKKTLAEAVAQLGKSGREPTKWIRGVGYHESVCGILDAAILDALCPNFPVRVQHRSGTLWMFNTEGLRLSGLAESQDPAVERDPSGKATGRVWRDDRLLRREAHLDRGSRGYAADSEELTALRDLSAVAARWGVTGLTDATPDHTQESLSHLEHLCESALTQRVVLMSGTGMKLSAPIGPSGLSTEVEPREVQDQRTRLGPVKVMLHDGDLPSLDDLAEMIVGAHQEHRAVAVHCVTVPQLALTVAALGQIQPVGDVQQNHHVPAGGGYGDRIEHGSLIPRQMDPAVACLGVTVVTQPNFIPERGDAYLSDLPSDEIDDLYRIRTLCDSGISVAAGTDAPFGSPDPWAAMRAAVYRRTHSGSRIGRAERVNGLRAIDLFVGHYRRPAQARRVRTGTLADLCLLSCPLAEASTSLGSDMVRLTLVGGTVTHRHPDI